MFTIYFHEIVWGDSPNDAYEFYATIQLFAD